MRFRATAGRTELQFLGCGTMVHRHTRNGSLLEEKTSGKNTTSAFSVCLSSMKLGCCIMVKASRN